MLVSAKADVRVRDDGRHFVLTNDRITARIDKARASLVSLQRGDLEMLRGGSGYWSVTGGSDRGRVQSFPQTGGARVIQEGGAVGEVEVEARYEGAPGTWPVNVSFRYALTEGSDSLHLYAVIDHPAGLPGFSIGEARYVVKPDPEVFDHFTVDAARSRRMPTGADWDAGMQLNMKEVRRMQTGIHRGEVEHKYGYSAVFSESPAYGWSSAAKRVGLWMVHPSLESIAGGPVKPELTGHLDVNPGGRPVLLNMWHGSHYGGTVLNVRENESWTKVIGPFLLHTNAGGDAVSLWRKAMETAAKESRNWPYRWVGVADYQASERVPVQGRVKIEGEPSRDVGGEVWVGLTAPDYVVRSRWGAETVGWQRDGKHYQYWVKAAADGSFRLPSVRPGRHVLRIFAQGVLGEYERADIEVKAGSPLDLGEIVWRPERAGPTVWEIGIPDRSAREFRNGDRYWQWGQHFRYREEFPEGVDYTVGRSDWRKDWNLCQPLRLDEHGRVLGDSVWKVRFDLKEPGEHRLRIALCGHRQDDRLRVSLNGHAIGDSGPLRENGVMHRDGHRGALTMLDFRVPAEITRKGGNVLELRLSGRFWHQALLYDYLRLEQVERSVAAGGR